MLVLTKYRTCGCANLEAVLGLILKACHIINYAVSGLGIVAIIFDNIIAAYYLISTVFCLTPSDFDSLHYSFHIILFTWIHTLAK
jgi:hypothetical protein